MLTNGFVFSECVLGRCNVDMDLLDARKKDGPMEEQQKGVYALRSGLSDEKPRSSIHQGESRKS